MIMIGEQEVNYATITQEILRHKIFHPTGTIQPYSHRIDQSSLSPISITPCLTWFLIIKKPSRRQMVPLLDLVSNHMGQLNCQMSNQGRQSTTSAQGEEWTITLILLARDEIGGHEIIFFYLLLDRKGTQEPRLRV